jgi:transposase
VIAQQEKIAMLEATIVELRAQLNRNSQNSSRPPSSDMPGDRPPPKGKHGKRRKRGGQPGHQRNLSAPPERVDDVKEHRPPNCGHCGADLAAGTATGSVENHYVYELPEIWPIVTDHQCIHVECPHCGGVTRGQLPPGVPTGNYGPSVQAMTALLRGDLRQSVRQTSDAMTKLFHVPMSTGMVAKTQHQVSRALKAPYEEALAFVQRSDRLHADETSWTENKKKAWLWVAVAVMVTVFMVRARRNAQVAKELIGESFRGILTTDRWASYNWLAASARQLCWSHLKRDVLSFLDYGAEAKCLGRRLLRAHRKLFRLWHRARDGNIGRAELKLATLPVRRRILALLEEGTGLQSPKVRGMCREILKLQEALFTFLDHEGVEPTNNAAERAVRFAVLMRKGCFGSDSAAGSRFVERFLTARASLRSQKRDLYAFLKDACTAALHGTQAPSLLPNSAVLPTGRALAA